MTTTVTDTQDFAGILSSLDRCDSCGAQAYVKATLSNGELLFCAHHATRFKEKLMPTVVSWHDESAKLADGRD